MQELKNFLALSPFLQKFGEAVKLFEQHSNNTIKVKYFKSSTSKVMPELLKELQELSSDEVEITPVEELPTKEEKQKEVYTVIKSFQEYPEELQKVVAYKDEKYRELQKVRNGLLECATVEKRAEAIDEVKALFEVNAELWKEVDHYVDHGKFQDKNPIEVETKKEGETALEMQRKLNNIRSSLSKSKKRLEGIKAKYGEESPKYLSAVSKQEKLIAIKEDLEQRLKSLS